MDCKVLVLYWSKGGNTRKVAETIHATVEGKGLSPEIAEITADLDLDVYSYNLVFAGAPVYYNLGPPQVMKFFHKLRRSAANQAAAPEKPGHYAVAFCTFGGGHTGVGEAVPFLKFIGQVFEHDGIRVVDEWPVVGEFPEIRDSNPLYNKAGRLGDITGRPHEGDLRIVAGKVIGLLYRLQHKLGIEALMQK